MTPPNTNTLPVTNWPVQSGFFCPTTQPARLNSTWIQCKGEVLHSQPKNYLLLFRIIIITSRRAWLFRPLQILFALPDHTLSRPRLPRLRRCYTSSRCQVSSCFPASFIWWPVIVSARQEVPGNHKTYRTVRRMFSFVWRCHTVLMSLPFQKSKQLNRFEHQAEESSMKLKHNAAVTRTTA